MTHLSLHEEHADLIASLEATLNQSFKGKSLQEVILAVQTRIAELKVPAELEPEFDASSLELGILQELLNQLISMGGVSATSFNTH